MFTNNKFISKEKVCDYILSGPSKSITAYQQHQHKIVSKKVSTSFN